MHRVRRVRVLLHSYSMHGHVISTYRVVRPLKVFFLEIEMLHLGMPMAKRTQFVGRDGDEYWQVNHSALMQVQKPQKASCLGFKYNNIFRMHSYPSRFFPTVIFSAGP